MTQFKVGAISKFYKEHFKNDVVVEYVGIAKDELDRVNFIKRENTIKVYPLIYWNMTENDCLVKCYKAGFNWFEDGVDLYSVLDRVSCYCCSNKNLKELKAIYNYLPTYWQKLKDLQDKTNIPFKNGETIQDLENRFKESL